MEVETNRIINDMQDYAKLQDSLIIIRQALETGGIPDILPTFNDSFNDEMLTVILDMVRMLKAGVNPDE
jgi:hypothetical protein